MKVSEFCKDRGNVVKAINEDIAGVKGHSLQELRSRRIPQVKRADRASTGKLISF